MAFQYPQAFYLLILLVPLLYILWISNRNTRNLISGLKSNPQRAFIYIARTIMIMLLIISLVSVVSRPYSRLQRTADILFLVDVSRSMQARKTCSQPSYLDRAKNIMKTVITGIPEARFGISVYERLSFPITHMTYDHSYLDRVIENGIYDGLIFDRTASRLGDALSTIASKKNRLPGTYEDLQAVVLLTDGNISSSDIQELEAPLQNITDAGLTIIPVGIGNPDPTPIPTKENGECVDKFIVKEGTLITVSLHSEQLQYLAGSTSGRYFGEAELDDLVVYLRETTLKDTFVDSGLTQRQRTDISWIFLLISTIALFGYMYIDMNPGPGYIRKK